MSNKKSGDRIQEQFRLKHLKPDWDGCAANEFFAQQYRSGIRERYRYKPKDDHHIFMMEVEIAESDFYRNHAHVAFSKSKFCSELECLNANAIRVPEDIVNKPTYTDVYLRVARDTLGNIRQGKYDFQHPSQA